MKENFIATLSDKGIASVIENKNGCWIYLFLGTTKLPIEALIDFAKNTEIIS